MQLTPGVAVVPPRSELQPFLFLRACDVALVVLRDPIPEAASAAAANASLFCRWSSRWRWCGRRWSGKASQEGGREGRKGKREEGGRQPPRQSPKTTFNTANGGAHSLMRSLARPLLRPSVRTSVWGNEGRRRRQSGRLEKRRGRTNARGREGAASLPRQRQPAVARRRRRRCPCVHLSHVTEL